MDWNTVLINLTQALIPVLVTLLSGLVGVGIAKLKKSIDNENYYKYLDALHNIVAELVGEAEQITVKGLKLASDDGKLTPDEGKDILKDVKDAVIKQLPDKAWKALTLVLGDMDKFIAALIEHEVSKQ